MNKVFNINLGGYPFTIDDDAYEHLNHYLDTIHAHFRNSEGYEDITSDIEARMAELFQEQGSGRPIVTLKVVKNAIGIMGTPEDFGAEPMEEASYASQGAASSGTGKKKKKRKWSETIKTGKRLFRNPEDEVVGGVASGIAAYFGVNDPLWIRLGFVLITLSGGFGIPLYLLLWAILPKAESSSDRLAMKGEPINIENIAKTVEEEIEGLSQTLSDLGSDLETEFTKKKRLVEPELSGRPLRKGFLF